MTGKSRPDPERLQPTSGRDRMTIDHPVEILRMPDEPALEAEVRPTDP